MSAGRWGLDELLKAVEIIDAHLDSSANPEYQAQPLAQDWARGTKACEEAGEIWKALSAMTGENPRKGVCGTEDELFEEMGDTISAAFCGIQHFTKNIDRTWACVAAAFLKACRRVAEQAGTDA
jgi:hypothetical protein